MIDEQRSHQDNLADQWICSFVEFQISDGLRKDNRLARSIVSLAGVIRLHASVSVVRAICAYSPFLRYNFLFVLLGGASI